MAKMKVHELAKELDLSSKEIVAYLNSAGIEAKAAQSTVEESAVEMVRKHFEKSPDSVSDKDNKKEEKASKESRALDENMPPSNLEGGKPDLDKLKKEEEKSTVKEEKNSLENRTEGEKKESVKSDSAKSETLKKPVREADKEGKGNIKRENPSQVDAPKKKKTIIFVNNANSGMQGNRNQGSRPQQGNLNQGDKRNHDNRPVNKNLNQSGAVRSIQGNQYAPHQIIKPRPEALNRVHENRAEEKEETVLKENVNTEINLVSTNNEPKREYLKDIRSERPVKEEGSEKVSSQEKTKSSLGEGNTNRNFKEKSEGQVSSDRNSNRNSDRRDRGQGNFNSDRRDRGQAGTERRNFQGSDRPGFNKDQSRMNQNQRPGQNSDRNSNQQRNGQASRMSFAGSQADNSLVNDKPGSNRRDDKFKNKNYDNKDTEKKQSEKRRNQERDNRKNRDFLMGDDEETLAMKRRTGKFIKPEKKPEVEEEVIKVITVEDTITIKDLADKMKIQPAQIVKKLFLQGQIVNVNSEISFEDAENIAIEYEIICEKAVKVDVIEELLKEEEEAESDMVSRPPVVCVMGHVDHGKTSLLDAIRKTNVTDREAGGITQAIGAYTVRVKDRDITFLDTPGHEAFTAMRMRGANSTDIAVLVVAADDGVMPQTVEAINHAKAAGVEVIVAVNKIDKPAANPEKVKQELTEYELIPTDWGGSTEFVNISAKKGDGIDDLLETILLTADIMELKADPNRKARGLVIEAELDKGRGPVATVLVQKGTLKVGDFVSAGACHGKVRAMINDKGKQIKTAGPSIPVEILGLNDVPNAGEVFIAHKDDKTAKSFAETFIAQNKEKKLEEIKAKMSLDELFNKIQEGNLKELNIIVKADVQGSVEAVKQSLSKLSNEEVVVKCIHGGVGAINESDVTLASASNAIIIGFNVRTDAVAKTTAEHEGVDIRLYKVIYQAIEDIEAAMKGMLDPVFEEKIIGHAEIRQIFKASQVGNIAGSYILDGLFQRNCKVRITREGEQIYEGELASLKRFKDDVKEVKAGFECGLVFDGFDQIQELDQVEAYIMVEVPR